VVRLHPGPLTPRIRPTLRVDHDDSQGVVTTFMLVEPTPAKPASAADGHSAEASDRSLAVCSPRSNRIEANTMGYAE
jgi:hypothetical protein